MAGLWPHDDLVKATSDCWCGGRAACDHPSFPLPCEGDHFLRPAGFREPTNPRRGPQGWEEPTTTESQPYVWPLPMGSQGTVYGTQCPPCLQLFCRPCTLSGRGWGGDREVDTTEKSQSTHSTPVWVANCPTRTGARPGGSVGKEDRAGKMGRGPGQGHESKGCCGRGLLPEQGQSGGLSEPSPMPWAQLPTREISSTFPILPPRKTRRREKKKNLLERDYITAASQPVTSPSLLALGARGPEQGPPAQCHHTEGDGQPAPASCPSPPHSVPGPGLSRGGTSPVPIPPTQGFPYFLTGSCCFCRPMAARARHVCLHS